MGRGRGDAGDTEVLRANRRFYERIADVYDRVDRRRAARRDHGWLDRVLDGVCATASRSGGRGLVLLDAGTGSGFLPARARGRFARVLLVDVSTAMLARVEVPGAERLCADVCALPVRSGGVDVVTAFATLHHLYEPATFLREAARVLRPGGVLYTDHDLDARFARRLAAPLAVYRRLCDHGHGYLAACPEAERADYETSEFHGERGLEGDALRGALVEAGFADVAVTRHWEGMGFVERIPWLGAALGRRGLGPVLRLVAVRA